MNWLIAGGGVLTAVVAALGTVFVQRLASRSTERVELTKASGTVNTAEAAEIYAEGTRIRQELYTEVHSLRGEVTELRSVVSAQTVEMSGMRIEMARQSATIEAQTTESGYLRSQLEAQGKGGGS